MRQMATLIIFESIFGNNKLSVEGLREGNAFEHEKEKCCLTIKVVLDEAFMS